MNTLDKKDSYPISSSKGWVQTHGHLFGPGQIQ